MADCKACGAWFSSTAKTEICPTCERALKRLNGYAVEVVRCKDCKYRGTDWCIFHVKGEPADEELLKKLDNDFCSYGERIEKE